jgi:hypothetical protein
MGQLHKKVENIAITDYPLNHSQRQLPQFDSTRLG